MSRTRPARAGRPAVAVVLAAVLLAGCSGATNGDAPDAGLSSEPSTRVPTTTSAQPTAAATRLTDAAPCPGTTDFTCATLSVPLDHARRAGPTLPLRVAVETEQAAPRGVLLALAGGPGQAGVPLASRIAERFGPDVVQAYRVVMLDQRGTGNTALRCPAMQEAMGASDLAPPPAPAVTACAGAIGAERRFYSTEDVVADLDQLRRALGADRVSLLGVSYGTFVAEHYALTHPHRTARLVLDSVVPHGGIDPLSVVGIQAVRRVLRAACRANGCPGDPVDDVAQVVRRQGNGVEVLDLLTIMSIVDPTYSQALPALHDAAQGRPEELQGLIEGYRNGTAVPADDLSQGLHASALCSDMRFPWGDSAVPVDRRQRALDAAAGRLTAGELAPFDVATAVGTGFIRQCLPWPVTEPARLSAARDLPPVPVLLLAGDRDLSTPLAWARAEAARAPRGKLVVLPGAGHSVISRGGGAQQALQRFLLEG